MFEETIAMFFSFVFFHVKYCSELILVCANWREDVRNESLISAGLCLTSLFVRVGDESPQIKKTPHAEIEAKLC